MQVEDAITVIAIKIVLKNALLVRETGALNSAAVYPEYDKPNSTAGPVQAFSVQMLWWFGFRREPRIYAGEGGRCSRLEKTRQ
jgi:hypothetical protein